MGRDTERALPMAGVEGRSGHEVLPARTTALIIAILPLQRRQTFVYDLDDTVYLFFFFQAEDGIRDATVTGVQTCAIPICLRFDSACRDRSRPSLPRPPSNPGSAGRSDERRVGKECTARSSPYHSGRK